MRVFLALIGWVAYDLILFTLFNPNGWIVTILGALGALGFGWLAFGDLKGK